MVVLWDKVVASKTENMMLRAITFDGKQHLASIGHEYFYRFDVQGNLVGKVPMPKILVGLSYRSAYFHVLADGPVRTGVMRLRAA